MNQHDDANVASQREAGRLLLTVSEAAARLSMGRSFVYRRVMAGDIASIRLGRSRRIPVAALEQYVAQLVERESQDDA